MKIDKEATFQMIHNNGFFEMVVARFGEWNKLIRTLAYMRRFHTRFKREISVQEIKSTEDFAIKLNEINNLKRGKEVPNSSKIKKYAPFLDEQGFLRVGRRLKQALLSDDEKHPKFLHSLSGITKLLVLKTHQKLLHEESTEVLYYLRRKYWLIRGRRTIRSQLRTSQGIQKILTNEKVEWSFIAPLSPW
uniref:Integrase zinc-binding domain-containing protein n=1 Tax=Strigamia maritima TaxID=126957 RepID=T1IZP9_STRMM